MFATSSPPMNTPISYEVRTFKQVQQNIVLSKNAQVLLDQVLSGFFKNTNGIIKVDALEGGHSTNGVVSLLINDGSKKYVLRMKPEEPSQQALQCEHYAMVEGAKRQISPWIYFSTDDHRAILMEFVNANTLTVAEAQQPSNCTAIAKAIRKAHGVSHNPYFGSCEDEVVESVFQELSRDPKLASQVTEAIEIMRNCNTKLGHHDSLLVNNHGDLNSRNMFITANGPMLIDWEYTNLADPFEDLSYFCLRHNYHGNLERFFLESYLDRLPTEKDLEKYYLYKKKMCAKLCIYFHYFSKKFNPEGITFPNSSKTWAEYMIDYSERSDGILPQFYFELANLAFTQARAIE